MISSCRTDPIITLSDGTQLDITASIDTPPGRVTSVSYVVHVPAGLSAEKVVYTGGEFTNKESLKLYADQQPGSYSTTTYVGTESVTTMTATSTMRPASSESGGDQGNSHSASASIDGHTEQDLTVNF